MRSYYIYIMSSPRGVLYTGVTNNIWNRVMSHKHSKQPGFTQKYNVTRLVYYEETKYIDIALAREKEIKGWRRSKKIKLVESINPRWKNLAEDWFCDDDL